MKYADFLTKTSFTMEEILAASWGSLLDDPPPGVTQLPAPPMLMIDRVLELRREGPRGRMVAEQDVRLDAWFFQCHFRRDPVQPGCLGVDAIWQLLGLYMSANGGTGAGRALGCKEVDFFGQIRPHNKLVRYEVDVRRFARLKDSGASMIVADAAVFVDSEHIYSIKGAKVGLFRDIQYPDYPNRSKNAVGGVMDRGGSG